MASCHILSVTMEIQNLQEGVACQVTISHQRDVVEGQIQTHSSLRYHGNTSESTIGAVAGEAQVAATAGRPAFVRV